MRIIFLFNLLIFLLGEGASSTEKKCNIPGEIEKARQELRELGLSTKEINEFMGDASAPITAKKTAKPPTTIGKVKAELKLQGLSSQQIDDFVEIGLKEYKSSKPASIHVETSGLSKTSKGASYFDDVKTFKSTKANTFDVSNCCEFDSSNIVLRNIYEDVPQLKKADDPGFWALPVDAKGIGHPRGHPNDPYYIGHNYSKPLPTEYVLLPESKAPKKIKKIAWLNEIELHSIKIENGLLSTETEGTFYKILEETTGIKKSDLTQIPPPLVGEGSFHYVFNICPKEKKCFVAKLKKVLSGTVDEKTMQQLIEVFVHDAYMEQKQQDFLERVLYINTETNNPAEYLVEGKEAKGMLPGYPKKQLAEVIKSPYPESIKKGLITQDYIPWETKNLYFKKQTEELIDAKILKERSDKILKEALTATKGQYSEEYQKAVGDFLDRLKNYKTKTGPDVQNIDEFLTLCKNLSISRTALRLCSDFRVAFNIPDDFENRLLALEQAYRDSASSVIKDRRKNFKRVILGNADLYSDSAKEVGFDLNHGSNVMWQPEKGMFGIPDR